MKEEFLNLVKACEKDEDLLDFVEMAMNTITKYVARVTHMEYALPIYKARYEGQELRDKIQTLDELRRSAHEAAISAVKSMDRLAKKLHVKPMYTGDLDNRYQIADFCENMVHEFFIDRISTPEHTLGDYIAKATQEELISVKNGDSVMQVTHSEFERALLDGNPYEIVDSFSPIHNIPDFTIEH